MKGLKVILDEEAVVRAVKAHIKTELHLDVEVNFLRGIVPRKANAMLSIEADISPKVSPATPAESGLPDPEPVEPEDDADFDEEAAEMLKRDHTAESKSIFADAPEAVTFEAAAEDSDGPLL